MNSFVTSEVPSDVRANRVTTPAWRAALDRCKRVLRRIEPYGQGVLVLALRLIYGWSFVETGWGKLMHFERTTDFFTGLGLPAPAFMAGAVATTELVGGILLLLGAGTRYVAAALSVVLSVAFLTAHRAEAFQSLSAFTEQAPYPFLVACLVLLAFGAGRLSADRLIRMWLERRWWRAVPPDMD